MSTVEIQADITLDKNLSVAGDKTIDGGNHTVTTPVGKTTATKDGVLVNSGTTVIKNIKINVSGLADKTKWGGNYGIQVFAGNTIIENVTATGANAGILINGSKAVMKGTIDVSGNGFGGIEVSQGAKTDVPSLDASAATFVNTDEAYGKPTIWIDGYSKIGKVVTAPAGMTAVEFKGEDGKKDQLHFYIDAANASKE